LHHRDWHHRRRRCVRLVLLLVRWLRSIRTPTHRSATTDEDCTFLVRFIGLGCNSLIGAALKPLPDETLRVTRWRAGSAGVTVLHLRTLTAGGIEDEPREKDDTGDIVTSGKLASVDETEPVSETSWRPLSWQPCPSETSVTDMSCALKQKSPWATLGLTVRKILLSLADADAKRLPNWNAVSHVSYGIKEREMVRFWSSEALSDEDHTLWAKESSLCFFEPNISM
jgi:hypothetical protein